MARGPDQRRQQRKAHKNKNCATVVVVEDVEDVLPLVVLNDVDDGCTVQRSDEERKRFVIAAVVERRGVVTGVGRPSVTSGEAAAQRLVDGGRGADDRELECGGEL